MYFFRDSYPDSGQGMSPHVAVRGLCGFSVEFLLKSLPAQKLAEGRVQDWLTGGEPRIKGYASARIKVAMMEETDVFRVWTPTQVERINSDLADGRLIMGWDTGTALVRKAERSKTV